MIIFNNCYSVPGSHMVECRKYKLYQLCLRLRASTHVEMLSCAPIRGKFLKWLAIHNCLLSGLLHTYTLCEENRRLRVHTSKDFHRGPCAESLNWAITAGPTRASAYTYISVWYVRANVIIFGACVGLKLTWFDFVCELYIKVTWIYSILYDDWYNSMFLSDVLFSGRGSCLILK